MLEWQKSERERGIENPLLRRYSPCSLMILMAPDAEGTVRFGLDGAEYEIDLSTQHAQELRNALARYVGAARRLGGGARLHGLSSSRLPIG